MRAQAFYLLLPRHPLLRTLVLAAGMLVLAVLVAVGLVVGALALVVAPAWLLARRRLVRAKPRRADPNIIEGEFRVVPDRPPDALPHRD
ncbi:MAG: hypothetical protein ACREP2_04935 [Rhodanobacteraceae bacterium]